MVYFFIAIAPSLLSEKPTLIEIDSGRHQKTNPDDSQCDEFHSKHSTTNNNEECPRKDLKMISLEKKDSLLVSLLERND